MQTASELKQRGVKRTKVTRPDGSAFVSLENPALAETIFPPAEGYKVTEIYGYDADVDGTPTPLRPSPENEQWARELGCQWSPCAVCHHAACGFCPACNPDAIAPNGEAYDDDAE
jgi:hypothetical protein